MTITFATGCSGIGAPEMAWGNRLGWKCLWCSEIEPFPSAVLKYRWPDVPNVGDFLTIAERIRNDELEAPDVFIAGTPCQAFSVAGLRKSLKDQRGNLTLEYIRIANEMDLQRVRRGLPETIFVWENVPGVLSTKDNAFGCFIGGLLGFNFPVAPTDGRWGNYGSLSEYRAVAWRILDAQYFGVAQRRRRVFLIATARPGFSPARTLFEFGCLPRTAPPSRIKKQKTAPPALSNTETTISYEWWTGGGNSRYNHLHFVESVHAGQAKASMYLCVHGSQDTIFNREHAFALGRNNGLENVICYDNQTYAREPMDTGDVCCTLQAHCGTGGNVLPFLQKIFQSMENLYTMKTIIGFVRRLTTVECARLQGFPDHHTEIPRRGKKQSECPDGAQYKAYGNSMCVNVIEWIGKQIKKELENPKPLTLHLSEQMEFDFFETEKH